MTRYAENTQVSSSKSRQAPAAAAGVEMSPVKVWYDEAPVSFDEERALQFSWFDSGPGARPMHPDWARSLRDQCAAAGVPFFFKQWGDWVPALVRQEEDWIGGACFDDPRGGVTAAPLAGITGRRLRRLDDHLVAVRVGKRRAGRELDGRTHDEIPGVRP